MGTVDDRLLAIDRSTGRTVRGFRRARRRRSDRGHRSDPAGYHYTTSPPTIVAGVAVVGSFVLDNQSNDEAPGVVRAFDVATGELRWAWDVVSPTGRSTLAPGETYPRNTPNAWSVFSADPSFVSLLSADPQHAADFYGALRGRTESLLELDRGARRARPAMCARTFRTVHVDVLGFRHRLAARAHGFQDRHRHRAGAHRADQAG